MRYTILLLALSLSCGAPQKKNSNPTATNNPETIDTKAAAHPKAPSEAEIQKIFTITTLDFLPEQRGLRSEHYPASNERRVDFFLPHIKNLGGGYIGVGTDQNFAFIAGARSEFAWLMDFDPVVVGINKIHLFFIEQSATYAEFKELWQRKNKAASLKLVQAHFKDFSDYKTILDGWKAAHQGYGDVPDRLKDLEYMSKHFGFRSFHNNPDDYNYLRDLALRKRIQPLPGDLTATKTMRAIAASAKKLNVTIRVLYPSNAEDYFNFPANYRKNILSLPTDEKSLVVRTVSAGAKEFGFPDGEKYPDHPLHYNIQPFSNFNLWMKVKSKLTVRSFMVHRKPLEKGFSSFVKTPQQAGVK